MTAYCDYFVRYSFTCPSGHTEIRGEIISGVSRELEAADDVEARRFVCSHCNADLASGRFLIRILVNEPMPSPEIPRKDKGLTDAPSK